MADIFSQQKRSAIMKAVGTRDTSPEIKVRSAIFRAGYRYSLCSAKLPGKPDIVLSRHKMVIFVQGCFWHGHDCRKGKRPSSNKKFWNDKINGNMQRDARNFRALRNSGWRVYKVWECSLVKDVNRIIKALDARKHDS